MSPDNRYLCVPAEHCAPPILRPGFLTGLPPLGLDPAELAILLVTRARELGC